MIKCEAARLYLSLKMKSGTRVRITNNIEALSYYGAEALAGKEVTINAIDSGELHGCSGRIIYVTYDGSEWYVKDEHVTLIDSGEPDE